MKKGIVKAFQWYYDNSYNPKGILSCRVTILFKNFWKQYKLIDFFKYGYYGEELKKGDKVCFEIDYDIKLKGLVKDDE